VPTAWIGPSDRQRQALSAIAAALGEIGFALPGSLSVRSYRCGKANCACHGEPPRLHGPYAQWTRRIGSRTVHTNLTPEQLEDYQPFFANAARLRALVEDLEALSVAAVSTDPRMRCPHDRGASG
jgi:hypothetical protein